MLEASQRYVHYNIQFALLFLWILLLVVILGNKMVFARVKAVFPQNLQAAMF